MKYKYELNKTLKDRAKKFKEFANGASQATVILKDNTVFSEILISDGSYIVAMRNETALPFDIAEIREIYQTSEDEKPSRRGGWLFWDDWS